jgi:hypothetical protein
MTVRKKQEIISFKVDESMAEAMTGIANRSEFIRSAILSALDHVCPLCLGAGTLSPDQRVHWDRFAEAHSVKRCGTCDALHLVCAQDEDVHDDERGGE